MEGSDEEMDWEEIEVTVDDTTEAPTNFTVVSEKAPQVRRENGELEITLKTVKKKKDDAVAK